jgi:glycosyltransferase involved in cell wall biosynthesis
MSCGVPPVVPAVGDVGTVARDGENALVVSSTTAAEVAGALQRLLDDPALHHHIQQGCLAMRERFASSYSLGAATAAWQAALHVPEPVEAGAHA